MENENIFARKKFTMDDFASQMKLVADYEIKKVLDVSVSSNVLSSECIGGFVSVSGKTDVSVTYVSADGEIRVVRASFDYANKQVFQIGLENTSAKDDIVLTSYNFSGNDVICFVMHKISYEGNFKYELKNFAENSNDLVLNTKTVSFPKFVLNCSDDFVVAEEFESNVSAASILGTSSKVILNEVSCLADKVSVLGKIYLEVMAGEEASVVPVVREFEFKQEVEAISVLPNMTADAELEIRNLTVTPELSNGKTNFVCVFDIHANVSVFDENETEIVRDMFSLKNEIGVTAGFLSMKNYAGFKVFEDTEVKTADVSSLENFDDIVGVFKPEFVEKEVLEENGKVLISGEISTLVLYKSTDEIMSKTESFPVKFEIQLEKGKLLREYEVAVQVSSFKVKAGKDLEVMFNTVCMAKYETEFEEEYIANFEVKAEKKQEVSGIRVYVTSENETVFDAARNLGVRPEVITSQNEIAGAFESGQKLYIYSPINMA